MTEIDGADPDLKNLPCQPCGWRLLIKPVDIEQTSSGGIVLANDTVKAKEYLRYVGKVVAMGHLCYAKSDFRQSEKTAPYPFCRVGNWVVFSKYAGQEIISRRDGNIQRYRLVDDDNVLAIVNDLSAIDIPL